MEIVVGPGRGELSLYEDFTPEPMQARLLRLAQEDPATGVLVQLLDRRGRLAWAQSVGVSTDRELAELVPPLPPIEFRRITAGVLAETFLFTGFLNVMGLLSLYCDTAATLPARPVVLDFGCGCGRLLRFFSNVADAWAAYGAEVHADMAKWCGDSLPGTTVAHTQIQPPLPFGDEQFDLIYALSVFTHLDPDSAAAWRAELERVLAPGGVMLLTTSGVPVLRRIANSESDQRAFQIDVERVRQIEAELEQTGLIHMPYPEATRAVAQAGDTYGITFTSKRIVKEEWPTSRLEAVGHLEGGLQGYQDIVVLRKQ